MSFQEEDEWLGLGSGFVLDDAFKCTSPLGADTSLQVPLRENSPIAVSPRDVMDFSFSDNSLAVPIRDFGFQSGNEPPRLSPVSSSFQSMAPLQNMAYEIANTTVVQEDAYNSFEQPSIVVNGHYQNIEQQIIQPQQGFFQAIPDVPIQQTVSTSSQPASSGNSTASGSLVQQILSAPSARQTPTPQLSRQRPIQPKTHNNGRKRASVNSNPGMTNKSSKADSSSTNANQTEVRFSMSALARITEIGAEMAQLQEQQDKLGINNSQRLSELQAQRASILYEALSSQNVGETVLSQVKQVAAAAAPISQTRQTTRVRSSHSSRSTHFESAPESPQYQPQMYLASHNHYPSTSTAQFQEYSTGTSNHGQLLHQQEQVTVRNQQHQRVYRTQNATTTVYHTSQLPPGTVYVQNVAQASQSQFTSSQPTVGEVVRQQHQLRQVSGTQQVIVQQVTTPQVVVATGAQAMSGAQIRTQIVQHSPLPAQIVLTSAVPQTHQMLVVAHRSSPAQTAKRLEEKRASRLGRLKKYFESLHETLATPDTETPFSDLRDVLQRLLPYHAYGEPSFKEEHIEQFDSNYMRATINLMEQRKRLEKRLRKVFFDEALHSTEVEERNLLLYLDGEYERQKLEEEREFVKQGNLEAFVRDSAIVAAFRGSDRDAVAKSAPMALSTKPSCSKSAIQQYEYHPFEEVSTPLSPYKSPSPFKSPTSSIRSLSPNKSPYASTYSPRVRARHTSQSKHSSPAPTSEHVHIRPPFKPRHTAEIVPSEKLDQKKGEDVSPLPNAALNVVSRQATPLRKMTNKDNSAVSSASHSPLHVSQEKPEIASAIVAPGRLPAKKELLSRARQGVPAEMRSPPAHSSLANATLSIRNSLDDGESDGSASPELGIDDVVDVRSTSPLMSQHSVPHDNILPPSKSEPQALQKIPQRSAIPVPPLFLQRKEKVITSPERTSQSAVNQEDSNSSLKFAADKPTERYRFKPQVPRPTPLSPLKSATPKQQFPDEHSLLTKDVNCGDIRIQDSVKQQVLNLPKPPPIRLKLKLGGKELYIENNENREKISEKKHRKHRKKKKEGRKKPYEDSKNPKSQHRTQDLKKSHVKKVKNDTSPQEVVAVTSNGIRMKLKFGLSASLLDSGDHSRNVLAKETTESKLTTRFLDPQPSTSKASALVPHQQLKIPRLKIRIGHDAPPLVIAPVRENHAFITPSVQPNTVTTFNRNDSDTEAERMRCATDEALRGMSNFSGLTRTNTSVLPWSTQHAP
ncbi:hypothetical protein DICVIV_05474 [Dictyocaulus viviparus]|uniref:GLTSCR protein conserved domain-containing protein n=1 Tax=Dictyocaulus viviparus TaxID=29172 RepID=A0A0D8XXD9_DICVI|nr:hypothetical protein DICVIV_05474 [Dictyocaulus viviparus]